MGYGILVGPTWVLAFRRNGVALSAGAVSVLVLPLHFDKNKVKIIPVSAMKACAGAGE